MELQGWKTQVAAVVAALLGALLLTWTERKRPEVQEALIGVLFVLASTAQILLLANDPHGGEALKDLLAGQILWVSTEQLVRAAVLTVVFLVVWFRCRERIGTIGFYVLFALMVTTSVQLVGVYLVFTTLIVPALATYRHAPSRQLWLGYALAIASYLVGLGVVRWSPTCRRARDRLGDGAARHPRAPDGERQSAQGARGLARKLRDAHAASRGDLQASGEPRSLVDRALGVEFARQRRRRRSGARCVPAASQRFVQVAQRLLAGAEHDRVHFEAHRLRAFVAEADVQAAVVDRARSSRRRSSRRA